MQCGLSEAAVWVIR